MTGRGQPDIPSAAFGIALMSAAMLMVPVVDGIAKLLSASHSPLFISWARYAAACLFALPWAIARFGWRDFLPREELPAHALRTVFATAAMTASSPAWPMRRWPMSPAPISSVRSLPWCWR